MQRKLLRQETTGDGWRRLKTAGDRWRPLETAGDRWRPLETAGDRWRPLETAGDRWRPQIVCKNRGWIFKNIQTIVGDLAMSCKHASGRLYISIYNDSASKGRHLTLKSQTRLASRDCKMLFLDFRFIYSIPSLLSSRKQKNMKLMALPISNTFKSLRKVINFKFQAP